MDGTDEDHNKGGSKMTFSYYTWNAQDGHLYDEDGTVDIFENGLPVQFTSADEAEQYLIDNDVRGCVV